jgi:hypothetical protein
MACSLGLRLRSIVGCKADSVDLLRLRVKFGYLNRRDLDPSAWLRNVAPGHRRYRQSRGPRGHIVTASNELSFKVSLIPDIKMTEQEHRPIPVPGISLPLLLPGTHSTFIVYEGPIGSERRNEAKFI